MNLPSNPELELAYQYVNHTDRSIFLTGRAGTGKTTFLHRIRREAVKRMVIVAPTGVAAINAGGMTIHSFFQLPFGPYLPGNEREAARQRRFSGEKIKLIRSLDLLIIDEISMVRADLLDGIDAVLRRYKNPTRPFGGVQLLLIGDLHQLPPVAKGEEWELLRVHYPTPYFFSSHALQKNKPVVVELKHIYRQSDRFFIDLLNRVRDNDLDTATLETLNSRYLPDFEPEEADGYITLTTHNASAQAINTQKLEALSGAPWKFSASVTGDFPAHAYPTDEELELKEGAQVMFVKNDPSREKRFFNGRIGKVIQIEEDSVEVLCPGDTEPIVVTALEWTNMKYSLDAQTKEVSEERIGTFTQLPLKLAWAITIHKSQGLTFERVILDAQAAFAHGQVYVALSRCKSFGGIVLSTKIAYQSVKTDATVQAYSEKAGRNAPGPEDLLQSKRTYQEALILELFGFGKLRSHLEKMKRILLEHESSLPEAWTSFQPVFQRAEEELFVTADKFCRQLRSLFARPTLPEENTVLQERIRKGAAWFGERLGGLLETPLGELPIVSDNRKIRQSALESLEDLRQEIFVSKAALKTTGSGFFAHTYLSAKAKAALDFQDIRRKRSDEAEGNQTYRNEEHPALYAQLQQWRRQVAAEQDVELYVVLPTRTLMELTRSLPRNKRELKQVKGIGKTRIEKYGETLLGLIDDYCLKQQIERPAPLPEKVDKPSRKPRKSNTKAMSFELFQSGKSIEEIAVERELKPSTIETHIAHFIALGKLNVFELVSAEKVEQLASFMAEHPAASLSEIKAHFGDACSYGDLKLVRAHLQAQNNND